MLSTLFFHRTLYNIYEGIFTVIYFVGSFHLLQMLFDDYILYLIESHAIVSEDFDDGLIEFSIIRNRNTGK